MPDVPLVASATRICKPSQYGKRRVEGPEVEAPEVEAPPVDRPLPVSDARELELAVVRCQIRGRHFRGGAVRKPNANRRRARLFERLGVEHRTETRLAAVPRRGRRRPRAAPLGRRLRTHHGETRCVTSIEHGAREENNENQLLLKIILIRRRPAVAVVAYPVVAVA